MFSFIRVRPTVLLAYGKRGSAANRILWYAAGDLSRAPALKDLVLVVSSRHGQGCVYGASRGLRVELAIFSLILDAY